MKGIMVVVTSILLIAGCKDGNSGSDGPKHPAAGTLSGSSYCDGTNLTQKYHDGLGGIYSEVVEENALQCAPERGTKSGPEYCEALDKFQDYHDGQYGTYPQLVESNSYDCGYGDPILEVSIEGFGARFKDATITVESSQMGEPVDFTWEHTIGVATQEGNVIKIRGDGRTGEGFLTITQGDRVEEYQYGIYNDEYCALSEDVSSGVVVDCQGYNVSARWNQGRPVRPAGVTWEEGGMIYYGEPDVDTQRVTWEVVWVQRAFTDEEKERYGEDADYNDLATMRSQMARMQKYLDDAGVHIDLKLVAAIYGPVNVNWTGRWLAENRPDLYKSTDLVVAWGASEPGTCGVAHAGLYFKSGRPRVAISRCGADTTLHEIGHAVGLAHGPENSGFPASGYIFPEFGHGRENLCNKTGTIMSYDSSKFGLSNSLMQCPDGAPKGGRDLTDEAYALNRIRYNVALIHDENLAEELKQAQAMRESITFSLRGDIEDDSEELILD